MLVTEERLDEIEFDVRTCYSRGVAVTAVAPILEIIADLRDERAENRRLRRDLKRYEWRFSNMTGPPNQAYMISVDDSVDPEIGVYAVAARDVGQAISYALRDEYGALFDLTAEEIIKEIQVQELYELDGWALKQPAGTPVPARLGAEAGYWGLCCERCESLIYIDEVAEWNDDETPVCEHCVEDEEMEKRRGDE